MMKRMTRARRVGLVATFFTALYLLALFRVVSVPLVDEEVAGEILPVIPWWLLVSFGSYSLGSLGRGLYSFRDCPEAYKELLEEITQAKDDLRSRGVAVD